MANMESKPRSRNIILACTTAWMATIALATIGYDRTETPIKMPSIPGVTRYNEEQDRLIEDTVPWLPLSSLFRASGDASTDKKVKVWSFNEPELRASGYDPLQDDRVSCGSVKHSFLGLELGEEEAYLNEEDNLRGSERLVELWCNYRAEDHPVEYFTVD